MKTYSNLNEISTKRISYILATKNRAHLLNDFFIQLKKLKKSNDEFIFIDGKSTDNTKKIVKKYQHLVDVFLSEPDLNTNHAYNKGILIAKGKYIKYLCDDDVIFPDGMKKAINVLEKYPEIELLICGGTRFRKLTNSLQTVYLPPGINYGKDIADVIKYGASGIGFVIRKSAYAKAGIAPQDWNADVTFAINCIKNGVNVRFCRIKLYHQVIYDFSINNAKKSERRNDYLVSIKQHTSTKFYLLFRLNLFLNDHPNLTKILKPLVKTSQFLRKIFTQPNSKKKASRKYVWDSRFS